MTVMEANQQNLLVLAANLKQTFDPKTGKQAELFLQSMEKSPGFSILLLQLLESSSTEPEVRFAASLFFKNYIRRNWVNQNVDAPDLISEEDRATIKSQIVKLMTQLPGKLQLQIGEAVSIISDSDFPDKWPQLMQDLLNGLSSEDFSVNNGILQTAHSIFKRWRHQVKSNELYNEIKHVLDIFAAPYLNLFKATDSMIDANFTNKEQLQTLFKTVLLLSKIFYSFNSQDIPEFFEDNQEGFMQLFKKYLLYSNPLMVTENDDDVGILENVKASICENLGLYVRKYEELFTLLPEFVNIVWKMLTTMSMQPKNDIVVSKALNFLTLIAQLQRHKEIFQSDNALRQICEKIIIPNLEIRDSDLEMFEDDPIEYIRRDLEGSDNDTRRRASRDFVRGLLELFEKEFTVLSLDYINIQLQAYESNKENWKAKDTAVNFFISLAVRTISSQAGVTKTNEFVNVVEFFTTYVLQDLQAPLGESNPLLKVDSIKYLYVFRNQLTKEQLTIVIPLLMAHLESNSYVVYTYAAICLEKILSMKMNNVPLFKAADVQQYAENLLVHLFRLIELGNTPEKLAENDHLMKAIMRVLVVSKHEAAQFAGIIINKLTSIIGEISKNPSNPKFNHYAFDSLAVLIRFICPVTPSAVDQFETLLLPLLERILSQDIQEFTPYVFQILAQLLTFRGTNQVPTTYQSLMQPLLQPTMWEVQGNIPAITRLLQNYLEKGYQYVLANNQLENYLGVFQKLMSSKTNDIYGFQLLESIIRYIPLSNLQPYLKNILFVLLNRLMKSKTSRFTKGLLQLICILSLIEKDGYCPEFFVSLFESIEPRLFANVMEALLPNALAQMALPHEKKLFVVSMTKLVCESSTLHNESNFTLCNAMIGEAVKMLKGQVEFSSNDDDDFDDVDLEDRSFQTIHAKLSATGRGIIDFAPGVKDVKTFFLQQLHALSTANPKFMPIVQSLPSELM